MNQVERLMAQRQTSAMVDSDLVVLELVRRPVTETASGGRLVGEPVTLPSQRFFMSRARGGTRQETPSGAGEVADERWVLLGSPTADVQEEDEFTLSSWRFAVDSVSVDREAGVQGIVRRTSAQAG